MLITSLNVTNLLAANGYLLICESGGNETSFHINGIQVFNINVEDLI